MKKFVLYSHLPNTEVYKERSNATWRRGKQKQQRNYVETGCYFTTDRCLPAMSRKGQAGILQDEILGFLQLHILPPMKSVTGFGPAVIKNLI